MKNYTVDHQNYHIFKAESGTDSQFVHFQWGKFDFRMTYSILEKGESQINSKNIFSSQDGSKYAVKKFEVMYHNEWYDYYAEFPSNLWNVAEGICVQELELTEI